MAGYTAEDIAALLSEHYTSMSEDEKKRVAGNQNITGYSEQDMKRIATELMNTIINSYLLEVRTRGAKTFNRGGVHVGRVKIANGEGNINIDFSVNTLHRPSFLRADGKGYTSDRGVDDIFALFTSGYDLKGKRAFGIWQSMNVFTGAPASRAGSSFIADTVKAYESLYPGVTISFPKEWGGNK